MCDISFIADQQFKKIFEFQPTHSWKLPKTAFKEPHFQIAELQEMKIILNNAKSQLNTFDLNDWSNYTKNRDLAGYVISQLKRKIKPEGLTVAWCKFYEILNKFPIVSPIENSFKSLHLCEAPGAFVTALNHYLRLNFSNISWEWWANTLNPYYEGNQCSEMIAEDWLICHTINHWLFGADFTGNLLEYYNHVNIVNQLESNDKIDLITADGSINCMNDPGEQEKLVEFLHYCETITALKLLNKNGTFILKIFTIFEKSTICLLYLLNCVFNQVFLFKPCTSKSGNSELYVVCINYNGKHLLKDLLNDLIVPYKNGTFSKDFSMFSLDNDIPSDFINQIENACKYFFLEKQITTINNNIHFYLNSSHDEEKALHKRKIEIANLYFKFNYIKPISKLWKIIAKPLYRNSNYLAENNNFICLKNWEISKYIKILSGKRIDQVNNCKKFIVIDKLLKKSSTYTRGENSLFNLILKKLDKKIVIITNNNNITLDWSCYYAYKKKLLNLIISNLKNEFEHLLFLNIPFHTHFLASIWFILGTAFECVYFDNGYSLFYKKIPSQVEIILTIFKDIDNNVYDKILHEDNASIKYPVDIVQLFEPHYFSTELNFIVPILNKCNNIQIY